MDPISSLSTRNAHKGLSQQTEVSYRKDTETTHKIQENLCCQKKMCCVAD